MIKRLMDSVALGFGLSAGRRLFEETAKEVENAFREPTPEELEKAEAEERKKALEREKERARILKEAEQRRLREEAEVDDELAALKRKLGK
jgi:hypothetical protein